MSTIWKRLSLVTLLRPRAFVLFAAGCIALVILLLLRPASKGGSELTSRIEGTWIISKNPKIGLSHLLRLSGDGRWTLFSVTSTGTNIAGNGDWYLSGSALKIRVGEIASLGTLVDSVHANGLAGLSVLLDSVSGRESLLRYDILNVTDTCMVVRSGGEQTTWYRNRPD